MQKLYCDGVHDDTLAIQERIDKGARVKKLILDNIFTANATGSPLVCLRNGGEIGALSLRDVDCAGEKIQRLVNEGSIGQMA